MIEDLYFSEREQGELPKDQPEISEGFWRGFVALVYRLTSDGSLAERFPFYCPDLHVPFTCDNDAVGNAFCGEHPNIPWPLDPTSMPRTADALDATQFFWRYVSKPRARRHHVFYAHEDLSDFVQEEARGDYRAHVNRLFRRNRHPYSLESDGRVVRLGPPVLRETLEGLLFQTGDEELNRLLESARHKFKSPDADTRRESLEKLWDAWERLKTLYGDKKTSIEQMITEAVAEQNLQERIRAEAIELTKIGNNFQIRHFETGKTPIASDEHIDYLFHRMFALIWLLLKAIGRLQ